MMCPFEREDDKCVCYRCRMEKWPRLYAIWALTESQVELPVIKSIEPSQRREWAENHVIGEHLFANSENVENDGRGDERGAVEALLRKASKIYRGARCRSRDGTWTSCSARTLSLA